MTAGAAFSGMFFSIKLFIRSIVCFSSCYTGVRETIVPKLLRPAPQRTTLFTIDREVF